MLDMWKRGPFCKELWSGKWPRGSVCAEGSPKFRVKALPFVYVDVGGSRFKALVDTGCSKSIIASWVKPGQLGKCGGSVVTVNGKEVRSIGEAKITIKIQDIPVIIDSVVMEELLSGVDVILGMDVISRMGGVVVQQLGVNFMRKLGEQNGNVAAATVPTHTLSVTDSDFSGEFDGTQWKVRWKWRDGNPPMLKNRVDCYESTKHEGVKVKFEADVERWIEQGWLVPCRDKPMCARNLDKGVIPLMAVVQPTKQKVRPVMDFRELNEFVECHPGTDVVLFCETIRKWRQMTEPLKLVDLKSAYLQLRVEEDLWQYQRVRYKDAEYFLTRLGFGLNCAPKIMMKILKTVLA